MPIYETLAAMADIADDKKFNFSSTPAQAKTALQDVANTGTKTVIDEITAAGVMNIANETLTVGGVEKTNNAFNNLNQHVAGIQAKTPRKTVEENSTDVVY